MPSQCQVPALRLDLSRPGFLEFLEIALAGTDWFDLGPALRNLM